jgi:hypothetical protein
MEFAAGKKDFRKFNFCFGLMIDGAFTPSSFPHRKSWVWSFAIEFTRKQTIVLGTLADTKTHTQPLLITQNLLISFHRILGSSFGVLLSSFKVPFFVFHFVIPVHQISSISYRLISPIVWGKFVIRRAPSLNFKEL